MFYDKLWSVDVGGAIPLGKKMSDIYPFGYTASSGLGFGFFKNKLKVGARVEYDRHNKTFSNLDNEKLKMVMGGVFVGYLLPLEERGRFYFYPTISVNRANVKDVIRLNNTNYYILNDETTLIELKASLLVKKISFNLSFLGGSLNAEFDNSIISEIEKDNEIYPIREVTNSKIKLGLNSFRYSIGIII